MIETTQYQDILTHWVLQFDSSVNVDFLIDNKIVSSLAGKTIDTVQRTEGISAGEHSFTYVVRPDTIPIKETFDIVKYDQLTFRFPTRDVNMALLDEEMVSAELSVSLSNNGTMITARPNQDIVPIQVVIDNHNPNDRTDSQQIEAGNKEQLDAFAALDFDKNNPLHIDLMAMAVKALINNSS